MIKKISLKNVIVECNSDNFTKVRIGNVLDYTGKSLEDIIAEQLGEVKALADITITVETKETNIVRVI